MRASRFLPFLVLALAILWGLEPWRDTFSQSAVGHPSGTACANCHLAGSDTNARNAHLLVASQERLCGRCHVDAIRVSHPSGFNPGRALPAGYPVDWKGDMTCSTCHEAHGSTPGFMRGTRHGKDLCLACHDEGFFRAMRDQGISLVQSGHLNLDMKTMMRELDAFSINCMGCHGQQADSNAVSIDGRLILRHNTTAMNHPIGRSYDDARRFGGYRPKAMISKKILLPNGRLSCLSCHEGYSKVHGRLVATDRPSLCMECHDL